MLQKEYAGNRITWTKWNALVEAAESNRPVVGTGNTRFTTGVHRPVVIGRVGGGGGIDPALFVFGYSVSGAIVTVSKGYCQHATRGTITLAAAPITIDTDHQFVVLNYVFGSGALTISLSPTYPVPEATIWRKPLHQWRLISGVASLEMFFPGNLEIPGAYA